MRKLDPREVVKVPVFTRDQKARRDDHWLLLLIAVAVDIAGALGMVGIVAALEQPAAEWRQPLAFGTEQPAWVDYVYKVTKEDEPSGGLSAGLPTALAFLSAFLDRPVPQDLAASGTLVADAHDVLVVKGVGEAEYKVRGAYNRNLRMLLLPAENRRDLAKTPLVPRAVTDSLVRWVSSFDEAVSLVFGEEVWT